MNNPALPDDQQRHHPHLTDDPKPPSETGVKTVKRTTIAFLTITVLTVLTSGLVELGNLQIHSALLNYETKEQAEEDKKQFQAKEDALQYQIDQNRKEYLEQRAEDRKEFQIQHDLDSKKLDDLSHLVNAMDKKVDRIVFTMDWMQAHEPRNGTPKDQPQ